MVVNPTLWRMREVARTEFGERLYFARKVHAKISQAMLAKAVGTSQSNIAELETTGQGSSFTPQLAQRCGVRVEWLATGEEPMVAAKAYSFANSTNRQVAAEPPSDYGLAMAVEKIAKAIEAADPATRADAAEMIALLLRNPIANSGLVPIIVEKLSGESVAPPIALTGR
jgi:hypothetical protein